MGLNEILSLAGQYGANGLFVAYLIWRESAERRERRDQATARIELEKAEIASRERLASSLTALSMVIQGRANV